ncbi:MAG: cell division protein ZapA [Gammaproteobacteria bacterium]|nr:cell division protein ZapA [Gammaproteobacteria bacterium]
MSQKLEITLLEKTMTVACPLGQAAALLESADILNKKMTEIQTKSPTTSLLNIALMSALNISHELISLKQQQDDDQQALLTRLDDLTHTIEQALTIEKT